MQEKDNDRINNIKFEKMTFDFSEFESLSTTYPKLSERDIFWLLNKNKDQKNAKAEQKYIIDVKEEIYKRLVKPLYVFVIFFIGCCLISHRENKKNQKRNLKIMLFVIGVVILLMNESLIKFSARNEIVEKLYFISPIIFSILMIYINRKFYNRLST